MLWNVKIPFLGNVAMLAMFLFLIILGYLGDFLLSTFGMKKGGND